VNPYGCGRESHALLDALQRPLRERDELADLLAQKALALARLRRERDSAIRAAVER